MEFTGFICFGDDQKRKNVMVTAYQVSVTYTRYDYTWLMTPCGLMYSYQRFEGTRCIYLQDTLPKNMETAVSS